MSEQTAAVYRALLIGLVGNGHRVSTVQESGNVPGFWTIETSSGFNIEFGPNEEEV